MRVVYYTMGWVLIFTAGFCVIRLGYENIDMTSQRLFITFWFEYFCYFMICIIGFIWIKFADRLSKHSENFILRPPSKNDEQPTWQTMNDLAKAINEDNKNGNLEIDAASEDIAKTIHELCKQNYILKQDCKFLSQEIVKREHLQDDKEIMRLFKKYNE